MAVLTPKRQAFCREYLKDCNGSAAAIRAGFAESGTSQEGSRLLAEADVQEEIGRLRQTVDEAAIASHQEVCEIMTAILRANVADFATMGADGSYIEVGPEGMHNPAVASIKSVTKYDKDGADAELLKEFKLLDKIRAAERLSRLRGYDSPTKLEGTGLAAPVVTIVKTNGDTEGPDGDPANP